MINKLKEQVKTLSKKANETNIPLLPALIMGAGILFIFASTQKTVLVVKKFYYK